MEEWTQGPALRVHAECVALCMAAYADRYEPDEKDRWIIAGLLHDFDYERYPTMEDHPIKGVEYLRANTDLDEGIIHTILAHAPHTGTARESMMDKCIFAVDELAGFIVACSKVRPNGIQDLAPKSVKKKLKDKAFAAAVNRQDIALGIQELGVDPTEHIQLCIDAIRAEKGRLGL